MGIERVRKGSEKIHWRMKGICETGGLWRKWEVQGVEWGVESGAPKFNGASLMS